MAKKPVKKAAAKVAAASKKRKGSQLGDPMKSFTMMKDSMIVLEDELRKFIDEEVKASARRSRVAAQDIKKAAANLRKEVQAVVASRKS